MHRKLYALLILIWVIGAFVLVYLYFFVYYTATLQIEANVSDYSVELFSESTALKKTHVCDEVSCMIPNVSPFEYTMTLKKQWYKNTISLIKIIPRETQSFEVYLEKHAKLTPVQIEPTEPTIEQIIQAKRDEKRFYIYFDIWVNEKITFSEEWWQLIVRYNSDREIFDIAKTEIVAKWDIYSEYITDSRDIFMKIWEDFYIFSDATKQIIKLPFEIGVRYIKLWKNKGEYLIVTDKWSFLSTLWGSTPEYQYLFKDFIYLRNEIIGIIEQDEVQKKQNFDLTDSGNLIVQYSQDDKTRKILLSTTDSINRIEKIGEKVLVIVGDIQYELENF